MLTIMRHRPGMHRSGMLDRFSTIKGWNSDVEKWRLVWQHSQRSCGMSEIVIHETPTARCSYRGL